MTWCEYELKECPSKEFVRSAHGTLHLVQPLHNTAGEVFGGELDAVQRDELERKVGGPDELKKLLGP